MGKILLGLIICAVLAAVVVAVVSYFSPERRGQRRVAKEDRQELLLTRLQLKIATDMLFKIAADDSGNPTLDAKIALDDITRKELS